MTGRIADGVKSHPDYSDGYFAGMRGETFDTDRADSEPYAYGFAAGDQARAVFLRLGFTQSGDDFSLRLTLRASDAQPEPRP